MKALFVGMIAGGLMQSATALSQPVVLVKAEPAGLVQLRLASGRIVSIHVEVELP